MQTGIPLPSLDNLGNSNSVFKCDFLAVDPQLNKVVPIKVLVKSGISQLEQVVNDVRRKVRSKM